MAALCGGEFNVSRKNDCGILQRYQGPAAVRRPSATIRAHGHVWYSRRHLFCTS